MCTRPLREWTVSLVFPHIWGYTGSSSLDPSIAASQQEPRNSAGLRIDKAAAPPCRIYSGYGPLCDVYMPHTDHPALMPRAKYDNCVARQTGAPGVRMLNLTVVYVLSAAGINRCRCCGLVSSMLTHTVHRYEVDSVVP